MGLIDFLFKKNAAPIKKTPTKTVNVEGVEYKYTKNRKSKYIKITIKGKNKIAVSMPYSCPYKAAEDFVNKKKEWIKEHLELRATDVIKEDFTTKTNNLVISTGLVKSPVIKKSKNIIQFIYPIGSNFYSDEIQNPLKTAVKKAMYIEAKNYLPRRVEELAEKFNFKYNKLSLKAHKTRWGSCSGRNNINLNINLMMLDDDYIDYVIIHELCHTVQKNHQKGFWELMEKCMPNSEELKKELKTKTFII